MKVPQDSAHRDRQVYHTTILLSKSHRSLDALVPKEHKVFMEEAYRGRDASPGTRQGRGRAARFQQRPSCPST